MFLVRSIYASRARPSLDESNLEQILIKPRENNAKQEITGMLIHMNGYFLQILEGSRLGVNDTYRRILKDERHSESTLIDYGEIGVRDFENWSMGYVPRRNIDHSVFLKYGRSSEFDPFSISADSAQKLLHYLMRCNL